MEDINKKFFCYKGKPLVRSGNVLYYGSMMDDFVVMLQVLDSKEENGVKLPNTVVVQLMHTDKNIPLKEMIVKKSEKKGLYQALDIADIWLTRALAD